MVRAKFKCERTRVETWGPADCNRMTYYHFRAVCADEIPENQRFQKYTPSGELVVQVENPAVVFAPGKSYYLDFTPAD